MADLDIAARRPAITSDIPIGGEECPTVCLISGGEGLCFSHSTD
jgi:hypothetical protein